MPRPKHKRGADAQGPFAVNLLKLSKKELSKALASLLENLKPVCSDEGEEEDLPAGMSEVAEQLSDARLMKHADKDVRLTTACCLMDVLRIYAPDAPYSEDTLESVFDLVVQQLQGLSTVTEANSASTTSQRYAYILESMAVVKSVFPLCEMVQQGRERSEDLLEALFDCLLSNAHEDQTGTIHGYMLDVLTVCCEEIESMPTSLIDAMLIYLLPASKKENMTSYRIVQVLLQRCFGKLQRPVGTYVAKLLKNNADVEMSEVKDHVQGLIYELHKTNPQLMLYVLPELIDLLEVEEDGLRFKMVELVARLFSARSGDYAKIYPQHFSTFVRRFKDKDANIRKRMFTFAVEVCSRSGVSTGGGGGGGGGEGMAANAKGLLSSEQVEVLENKIVDQMGDLDEEVRLEATHELCNVAFANLSALTESMVEKLLERAEDRRENIRRDAITGLAKIYGKTMGAIWHENVAADADGETYPWADVPDAEQRKLGAIPGKVILSARSRHSTPQAKMRSLLLLDDFVLPKALSAEARAAGLVHVYEHLNDTGKAALVLVLKDRATRQTHLARFVELVAARNAKPDDEDAEFALSSHLNIMGRCFPSSDNKHMALLSKLCRVKDKRVFRLLAVLADPCTQLKDVLAAREDIVKALDSKSPLGVYAKDMTRHVGMGFGGPEMVTAMLDMVMCKVGTPHAEDAIPCVDCLEMLLRYFPKIMRKVFGEVLEVFNELDSGSSSSSRSGSSAKSDACLKTRLLKVLEAAGVEIMPRGLSHSSSSSSSSNLNGEAGNFTSELERLCTRDGSADQAKLAVRIMASLHKRAEDTNSSANASKARAPPRGKKPKKESSGRMSLSDDSDEEEDDDHNGVANASLHRVVKSLTAARCLSVNNKRLVAALKALREAVRLFPDEFVGAAAKVYDFVLKEVVMQPYAGSGNGASSGKKSGSAARRSTIGGRGGNGSGFAFSEDCQRLCAGIKLLAAQLAAETKLVQCKKKIAAKKKSSTTIDEEDTAMDDDSGDDAALLAKVNDLLTVLFDVLDGRYPGDRSKGLVAAEKSQVRRVSGCAILTLCKGGQTLDPERWTRLAWTMNDPELRVREKFCRMVGEGITTFKLPLRYLSYLPFAVNEENPAMKKSAQLAILTTVTRHREAHCNALRKLVASEEATRGQSMVSTSSSSSFLLSANGANTSSVMDEDEEGKDVDEDGTSKKAKKKTAVKKKQQQKLESSSSVMSSMAAAEEAEGASESSDGDANQRMLSTSLMPEYAVPYLVHLITQRADFPANKTDAQGAKRMERFIKGLLEPLVQSLGAEADNVSFLMQMFDKIKLESCGPGDGDRQRFKLLSSIGQGCLRKMIKNPDNIKPYPGTIYLPEQLFSQITNMHESEDESTMGQDELSDEEEGNETRSSKQHKSTKATAFPAVGRGSGKKGTPAKRGRLPSWGSPIAPMSATSSSVDGLSRASSSGRKFGKKRRFGCDESSDDDDDEEEEEEEQDNVGTQWEAEEVLDMRCEQPKASPNGRRRNQSRKAKGAVFYLVKWAGRPVEEASWQPAHEVTDESLIRDYERRTAQMEEALREVEMQKQQLEDEEDEDKEDEEDRAKKSSHEENSSTRHTNRGVSEKNAATSKKKKSPVATSSSNRRGGRQLRNASNTAVTSSNGDEGQARSKAKKKRGADADAKEQVEASAPSKSVKRSRSRRKDGAGSSDSQDNDAKEENSDNAAMSMRQRRASVRSVR